MREASKGETLPAHSELQLCGCAEKLTALFHSWRKAELNRSMVPPTARVKGPNIKGIT
jgi:hypothetical protein